MDKKDIVILGASGFAKEILWLLEENNKIVDEWNILGFIDRSYPSKKELIHGYEVVGDDEWLVNYEDEIHVVCGVGSASLRKKIVQTFQDKENIIFPNLISRSAVLSDSVKMGRGCIVCTNSVLTVDICLGNFVTVNYDCTIGHDAVLEDFITLYPSVNVSGNVHIQSETEIGVGTQIIQGLTVGENTIIGAGAVVVRDIPSNCTAVGNPAKVIKQERMKTLIIAEAGLNHNGDIELAKKMIREAKRCGADIVKFQTAKVEMLVSKNAQKADYQKETTGSEETQYDMIKKLLLSFEEFETLNKYCQDNEIIFLSTPFDLPSIDFLNQLEMPFWKIPSGEITNLPYLIKVAETHKPIILSTGMSTLDEIEAAMTVLQDNGCSEITLLHCTTEYPAPYLDVNLKAMQTLKETFKVPVGYSDHTNGLEISVAAVAMGATVIEKHFTLDRTMEGPDHKASLEPDELAKMVSAIRNVELALGNGEKKPAQSEKKNKEIARKSITASRNIKTGDVFSEDNITTKRPGNGISPMSWFEVLGLKAGKDFEEDELIVL